MSKKDLAESSDAGNRPARGMLRLAIDAHMVEHSQIIACEPTAVGDNYA
ncbi:MAG: hypothetical protein ACREU6_05315 [Steroidobacteraceae bacterium]